MATGGSPEERLSVPSCNDSHLAKGILPAQGVWAIRKSDAGAFARALSHTLSFSSLPVAVDLREAETIHPKAVSEMVAVLNTPFPARLVEVLVSDRRPGLGDSVADSLYERPGEVPKHRP